MEQIQTDTMQQKTPVLVIIFSLIMLALGITKSVEYIYSLTIYAPILSILSIPSVLINLIITVVIIIASFGIRKMRKWALYLFSAVTLVIVFQFVDVLRIKIGILGLTGRLGVDSNDITSVIFVITSLVAVAYFWIISKKFA